MMYRFLAPLLAGFALAGASAFTAAFSRRWGVRGGQIATSVLRNLLGIPLYFLGLVLACQAPAPLLFDAGTATQVAAWAPIVTGSIPESPFARWWWLCPWLAIALAAALFVLWGLTWWTALLAALLLVCPALVIWGMFYLRSRL